MKKSIVRRMCLCAFMLLCTIAANAEKLKFQSYHVYTNDNDKYLQANEKLSKSIVSINEKKHEVKLSLFNSETKKWIPFVMKITYKVDLGIKTKIGTLYMCTNNNGSNCSVYVSKTKEEVFVDVHNIIEDGNVISCWMNSK